MSMTHISSIRMSKEVEGWVKRNEKTYVLMLLR